MNLSDYLTDGEILIHGTDCGPATKAESLAKLTELLSQATGYELDRLQAAILHREELMSTGIGHGLAVPHVRLEGLRRMAASVGIFSGGIDDYKSLDGEPVRIVVMIAAPKGGHEAYIRLLALVVDVLKQQSLREAILAAGEPGEVHRILTGGA
jgi:PTS system nitrogen regulatory IIA component